MAKVRTAIGAERKMRPPIADKRDRLWFPKDPSKHRIIVTEGLLRDYLDSGFNHVTYEMLGGNRDVGEFNELDQGSGLGSYVSWNVGRAEGRENVRGYLLEMDMDQWLEVKKAISEVRQEPLQQIRQEARDLQNQGFYVPGGGESIKIS